MKLPKDEFIAGVRETGKLSDVTFNALLEAIAKRANKKIIITVDAFSSKRSLAQNKLWWKYCTIVGFETGYSKEEMNEKLKKIFLAETVYDARFKGTNKYSYFILENESYVDIKTAAIHDEDELEEIEKGVVYKSTKDLSKIEFMELIDEIIPYVYEKYKVKLVRPDESIDLDFDR
jgi:hypothetical protein